MTRLGMLATLATLVFLTQGCIAAVALPLIKGSSPDKVSVASDRKQVKAELGKPIASERTPDGGRVDVFEYRIEGASQQGDTKFDLKLDGGALQGLAYYALLNVATFGGLDLAVSSLLVYLKLKTDPRGMVRVAFGPDDRVAWVGSPPPYGPLDGAVPLSVGAMRHGCRTPDDGEPSGRSVGGGGEENLTAAGDSYVRCVARRFAIWGIE